MPSGASSFAARYRRFLPGSPAGRPLAWCAVALVAIEAATAALGGKFPALSALVLLVAPGLALVPLLPARARATWPGALAAAPALGFAASSVALITLASAGVRLDGTSVRLVLAALVVGGLVAFRSGEPRGRPARAALAAGLGLLAIVGLAIVVEARVIGGSPVPGNDWAKYTLFADEIRIHGSLLIDNPYWMLGVPFREEPGVPAIYGSYLGLTGQPAAVLAHGIWVFAVAQVLAAYAFVRAFWGETAGVLAAGFWAVLPLNLDMLGWHGLPNAAALALLLLMLLYLATLLVDGLRWPDAVGFGLILVALAAAHRLSLIVGVATLGVAIGIAVFGKERARLLRGLGMTAVTTVVLAPGVAYDLVERNRSFGGTQSYKAYLASKADLSAVWQDLTLPFAIVAVAATVLGLRWVVRERALLPLVCLLGVVVALAYAWIVHVPVAYLRMSYFLPLALVPLAAIAISRIPSPRVLVAAGAALVAAMAIISFGQARDAHNLYAFANPGSLRGLDAVSAKLRPNEVVVTDRCWSFLSAWLLHTRTLPALDPSDIQPKAELARARAAKAIFAGTSQGRALARRLGVRYVLADPTCKDDDGHRLRPPPDGRVAFVSGRLVLYRLGPPA